MLKNIGSMFLETGGDKVSLIRVMAFMVCLSICFIMVYSLFTDRSYTDIENVVFYALGCVFVGKAGQKAVETYKKSE